MATAPTRLPDAAVAPPVPSAVDAMRPVVCRVVSVARELKDVTTLVLEPPADEAPFTFLPGQFNMLWAPGVGESAISISGSADEPRRIVHTIRSIGPVTQALCGLNRGDELAIRGPFGTAWPVAEAEGHDVVFVAGGIGLAPLRPALLHVLARRNRYGRVALLYGARSPADLLFQKDLESWRGRFDVTVEVTVDRAEAGWHGRVGFVTNLVDLPQLSPSESVAFVCGPELMMRFSCRELARRGIPTDRIHVSLERNMKCGCGLCGHCQLGPVFVCKDGPVFPLQEVAGLVTVREL